MFCLQNETLTKDFYKAYEKDININDACKIFLVQKNLN